MEYIPQNEELRVTLFAIAILGTVLLAASLYLIFGPLRNRLEIHRGRLTVLGRALLVAAPLSALICSFGYMAAPVMPRELQLTTVADAIHERYGFKLDRIDLMGLEYPSERPSSSRDFTFGGYEDWKRIDKSTTSQERDFFTISGYELRSKAGQMVLLDQNGDEPQSAELYRKARGDELSSEPRDELWWGLVKISQ